MFKQILIYHNSSEPYCSWRRLGGNQELSLSLFLSHPLSLSFLLLLFLSSCICVNSCASVFKGIEVRGWSHNLFCFSPLHLSDTGSFCEPNTHWFSNTACSASPRHPPVSVLPTLGLQTHATTPRFLPGVENPNPGPLLPQQAPCQPHCPSAPPGHSFSIS